MRKVSGEQVQTYFRGFHVKGVVSITPPTFNEPGDVMIDDLTVSLDGDLWVDPEELVDTQGGSIPTTAKLHEALLDAVAYGY